MPQHIAIIMDGNNRYAKAHGLPTGGGHIAGKDNLDPLVEHCMDIGIRALTVFAFSSENWQRPANEVALLMKLLEQTVHDQLPRMLRHQISLRFIGDRDALTPHLRAIMQDAEEQTAHFTKMSLVIATATAVSGTLSMPAAKLPNKWKKARLLLMPLPKTILHSTCRYRIYQPLIC